MINGKLTYISLFSCAGIGCYGFQLEDYECIATNEFLPKRLNIQKINQKCKFDTGYICGDIQLDDTKNKIKDEIKRWENLGNNGLDVLIATPPCQGMSIANLKKNTKDIKRNSLVVESVELIQQLQPKFFIFENVPSFLKTVCMDKEDNVLSINDLISQQLSSQYEFSSKIINFKNYGGNSSRKRTLVIGVRKDMIKEHFCLSNLFPTYRDEIVLKDVIGKYPSLDWNEISSDDIWHFFRIYPKEMRNWIHDMPEGMSAFDNEDDLKKPHKIVNGKIVFHVRKVSGKYTRTSYNSVMPCVHTRTDQMASQSTIHPKDDRVFSIRELMALMTIPDSFHWVENEDTINELPLVDKRDILKKNELTIRQCIGEAVPTNIFRQIAFQIKSYLLETTIS